MRPSPVGGPLHFECAVIKFYFWKRTALDVDFPLRNVRQRGDSRSRILTGAISCARSHLTCTCTISMSRRDDRPPVPRFWQFSFLQSADLFLYRAGIKHLKCRKDKGRRFFVERGLGRPNFYHNKVSGTKHARCSHPSPSASYTPPASAPTPRAHRPWPTMQPSSCLCL